jgi:hypothetical protein
MQSEWPFVFDLYQEPARTKYSASIPHGKSADAALRNETVSLAAVWPFA